MVLQVKEDLRMSIFGNKSRNGSRWKTGRGDVSMLDESTIAVETSDDGSEYGSDKSVGRHRALSTSKVDVSSDVFKVPQSLNPKVVMLRSGSVSSNGSKETMACFSDSDENQGRTTVAAKRMSNSMGKNPDSSGDTFYTPKSSQDPSILKRQYKSSSSKSHAQANCKRSGDETDYDPEILSSVKHRGSNPKRIRTHGTASSGKSYSTTSGRIHSEYKSESDLSSSEDDGIPTIKFQYRKKLKQQQPSEIESVQSKTSVVKKIPNQRGLIAQEIETTKRGSLVVVAEKKPRQSEMITQEIQTTRCESPFVEKNPKQRTLISQEIEKPSPKQTTKNTEKQGQAPVSVAPVEVLFPNEVPCVSPPAVPIPPTNVPRQVKPAVPCFSFFHPEHKPPEMVTFETMKNPSNKPFHVKQDQRGTYFPCLADISQSYTRLKNSHTYVNLKMPSTSPPVHVFNLQDAEWHQIYTGVKVCVVSKSGLIQTGRIFLAPKTLKPMEEANTYDLTVVPIDGEVVVKTQQCDLNMDGTVSLKSDKVGQGSEALILKGTTYSLENWNDAPLTLLFTMTTKESKSDDNNKVD